MYGDRHKNTHHILLTHFTKFANIFENKKTVNAAYCRDYLKKIAQKPSYTVVFINVAWKQIKPPRIFPTPVHLNRPLELPMPHERTRISALLKYALQRTRSSFVSADSKWLKQITEHGTLFICTFIDYRWHNIVKKTLTSPPYNHSHPPPSSSSTPTNPYPPPPFPS